MSFFGRQRGPVPDSTHLRRLLTEARLEVIPLKNLTAQLPYLPDAASVSVTASPTKTLEDTWELSKSLSERGLRPVPHLAARMVTDREQLALLVNRLADIGASELFLVGGDAPEPFGPFRDSIEVLEFILQPRLGFTGCSDSLLNERSFQVEGAPYNSQIINSPASPSPR